MKIYHKFLLYQNKLLKPYVRILLGLVEALTYLASLLLIVGVVYEHGFPLSIDEVANFQTLYKTVWIIFLIDVTLHISLEYRNTKKQYRRLAWILSGLLYLTLVPVIFHRPEEEGAILQIWEFLHGKFYHLLLLLVLSFLNLSNGLVRLLGRRTNPSLILAVSFMAIILIGAGLLMLPRCTVNGITWVDSLFTATSAVCVTGLVPVDVSTTFTTSGLVVIILLIQIGGLGVMTLTSFFAMFFMGNTSIYNQLVVRDMVSSNSLGSLLSTLLYILGFTLVIEGIGMVSIWFSIHGTLGMTLEGELGFAAFHSISAFCNAGFDILGTADNAFPSLTGYSGNILIHVVIMLLIITGGIGFLTWDDIYRNKMNFKRYRMQSKIILMTTVCLIIFPAVFFFACDLKNLPAGERLLAAMFQSVTTRTAGFNTIDISEMSEASKAVMILLMLIGGSPGSTAGGMKTTTFTVLILNAIATFRSQENAGAFGRRLEYHVIKNAATIAMLYFTLFFCGGVAISVYEGLPPLDCLYEAASAVGTVGLTLGVTPGHHDFSQVVLIILMYLGRVGGLTLIYAVFSGRNKGNAKLPLEKITVG